MKSSPAKVEANRRNAQRSTGPRTPEGKAASSRNATRTGLATMTLIIMPGESQDELDQLTQSIRNEWNPQGDHEDFLVDQMISARWRLERLARYEEEAMNKEIEGPGRFMSNEGIRRFQAKSAHRRVLDEMAQPNSIFDKLERYTRAAERAYSKAARELQQHRAAQARPQNRTKPRRNRPRNRKPKPGSNPNSRNSKNAASPTAWPASGTPNKTKPNSIILATSSPIPHRQRRQH